MLILNRAYLPDQSCTLGRLTLPCGWSCLTLENPWCHNQPEISCIPEGLYQLGQRTSPIVRRTSANEFTQGWQIENVAGRSFIMLHPGNWSCDTQGCILPGQSFFLTADKGLMVTNSRHTFRELMQRLSQQERWQLQITQQPGGRHD